MSAENFDDMLHEKDSDMIRAELAKESGLRAFGHIAMLARDGLAGEVIFTIVALPDSEDDQYPNRNK